MGFFRSVLTIVCAEGLAAVEVARRRILVVLLPALEKSPDELSNLGKVIISSLKSMMAAGLGDAVEGSWSGYVRRRDESSRARGRQRMADRPGNLYVGRRARRRGLGGVGDGWLRPGDLEGDDWGSCAALAY